MKFQDKRYEFLLIRMVVMIKFDDSLLEDIKEGVDAVVVGLLLEASCES
jgi:hypothetical protein